MRALCQIAFWVSVGMMSACTGPLERQVQSLRGRVRALESDLKGARDAAQGQRRVCDRLRSRVAVLDRELRTTRRLLLRRAARPSPPRAERSGPSAVAPGLRCPADLPAAARRIRRRMRLSRVKALLAGTEFHLSSAITLSDAGTRTARTVVGPCYRITLGNDRVTDVVLQGVMPRPARRHGRRHRRRRR